MNKLMNIHTLWLLMVLLTISTYLMGKLSMSGYLPAFLLLLTALIKGVIIIREYMELKGVSLLWRVMMYGWLWSVITAIAVTYLI